MSDFLSELISYVELGERDIELLRELHPRLEPHFPAIAEKFYAAVNDNPGASAVINGPDQLERLRCSLIDWMSSGLLGPYDDKFYEKRSRIGRRHVQIGLAQHYMFTAMNVVRTAYLQRISELYPTEQACDVVAAANKLLDIELAVMLRHYQLDSEEKLLMRERRIQADRLTAMQTLSAGLAHEVRNPLNAARLQLELLERRIRRQFGDDGRLTEPTALANHELERLTNLLNDFLSFARPPELHIHEHDVIAIGRQVIELEKPLAQHRGVHLTFEEAPPILALVDTGKIHQVIQNLVRNALEATPSGGHVRVAIENAADQMVHITVIDDGAGIPAEVLPRIYEPFYSTKETGTGMGMAIVHSLVTMHGGKIDIDTSPHGTRFDVFIPQRGA
ncbi:MAG TPA: protoglobin domain-containing protein [Kofleriaceae bacterium]|nr:protoglobin domain-containing protein [Kofleriaceae bacterium]